ncbi:hypothetical protein F957_02367 [Acinetobacter gyllenbergii CIP 110306 = MTCC 11365]|uniref:Uncharacterized protein n=2 Tax=Moraxellaceae TaxID=468 RepID=A0A829HGF4_9GAMM|nr:hypothetical protein F957_02367 [Acinetobacter gyllenbergii CIP 110306 = MTCC 11365]
MLRILKLMPFEFEVVMSQQPVEKRSVPWLLMGLGLLIPIFIVGMAFLAARSDAQTKKKYDQQHAEIAKKFEQQKQAEPSTQAE